MKLLIGRRALIAGVTGVLAMPALAQGRFPDKPIRVMAAS
ncbi:MAG: tripartite tricarboxylate transporter substrate binding protein, partial [Acetobacteraceae bacterium]|nr:tripartite tricarboxylate transporter substrate binding protein [Acetobacteraceae bacterium]